MLMSRYVADCARDHGCEAARDPFSLPTSTSNKAPNSLQQEPRDIVPQMPEMVPESKFLPGWIVQRFGGVSIQKFGVKIVEDIVKASIKGNRVAIVCSAMDMGCTATEGINGVTSQLLRAAQAALNHKSEEYLDLIDAIEENHIRAANELIGSTETLEYLTESITDECSQLTRLLGAAQILDEMTPRTRDRIIRGGERLSCMLMTALLKDRGIEAEYVNVEGIMDRTHTTNSGLDQELCEFFADRLAKRIQECRGKLPVVTGYFGTLPGMTIGRDYTDLCAAVLTVGLNADELQVWKEVDGIFTADPRAVSTARLIPRITVKEAAELTYSGVEMIHPFAMELVARSNIPIRIKNVQNSTGDGTIIFSEVAATSEGQTSPGHPPKRPTAVAVKNGTVVLNIHSNQRSLSYDLFADVFSILRRWRLIPDLISTSEVHVSVALNSLFAESDLKKATQELKKCGTVELTRNLAILSLVGMQMKQLVGIAGCMFSALAKEGVNVEMISQGLSEINISCVIKGEDAIRAMNILHTRMIMHQLDI